MQDNQFITQINDIYYNFDEYKGKTIQIEGFPMTNGQYVFVGRYEWDAVREMDMHLWNMNILKN